MSRVDFYSASTLIGTGAYVGTNGYRFAWENVGIGSYSLSARATDNLGATTASGTATITVNGSPFVELWRPTNSPSYTANATVPISAYAIDGGTGSVSKVEFFKGIDTVAFLTNTTPSGNVFSNNWTGVTNGSYAVYARATDNTGGTSLSQIEVFTVNTNLTFPTVSISSPTNGQTFKAWVNIDIAATTTPSQVKLVEFYSGTNFLGSDTNSPFTITVNGWKPGEYVLTAKATHTNDTIRTSAPVTITVKQPEPTGNGFWDPRFFSLDDDAGSPVMNEFALAVDPNGSVYSGLADQQEGGALRVRQWTNCVWSTPLSDGPGMYIYALRWDAGGLYVAGHGFTGSVGKLTGTNFVSVGNGFDFTDSPAPDLYKGVRAIHVIDGDLYVGGDFIASSSNTNVHFIARLDAASSTWVPVVAATNALNNTIRAIAEFGDALYVGGDFTAAGTNSTVQYLAKLVNGQWQPVGSGVNARVMALTAHNGRLFVGGDFTTAGGLTNANYIACWDGGKWSTISSGVSDGTYDNLRSWDVTNRVDAIAARGNEIYVGGDFTKAWNGNTPVTANYIARAAWDESTQIWSWSALDGGISRTDGYADRVEHVHAVAIRERTNAAGYDVIVAGAFTRAGGLPSYDLARWVIGTSDCPTTGPAVQITSPTEGAILTGSNATFYALASSGTNSITEVAFYVNGALIGDGAFDSGTGKWTNSVSDLVPGPYSVNAVATDSQTNSASSAPVNFTVKASTGPTPTNDLFYVLSTGVATNLNVLANDNSSGGALRIVGVNKWDNPFTTLRFGSVRIGYEGTNLIYHVNPFTFGTNVISYDVADNGGTNAGYATVIVRSPPTVQILTPADGLRTASPLQTPLIVSGTTFDYDGTVSNVKLYTNGVQWGSCYELF